MKATLAKFAIATAAAYVSYVAAMWFVLPAAVHVLTGGTVTPK